MLGSGLRPASNPSEILISKKDEVLSGNVIAASLEGMRPLMIEIQALVEFGSIWNTSKKCHRLQFKTFTYAISRS